MLIIWAKSQCTGIKCFFLMFEPICIRNYNATQSIAQSHSSFGALSWREGVFPQCEMSWLSWSATCYTRSRIAPIPQQNQFTVVSQIVRRNAMWGPGDTCGDLSLYKWLLEYKRKLLETDGNKFTRGLT